MKIYQLISIGIFSVLSMDEAYAGCYALGHLKFRNQTTHRVDVHVDQSCTCGNTTGSFAVAAGGSPFYATFEASNSGKGCGVKSTDIWYHVRIGSSEYAEIHVRKPVAKTVTVKNTPKLTTPYKVIEDPDDKPRESNNNIRGTYIVQ